jgi:predicted nucleic acid-binding protein
VIVVDANVAAKWFLPEKGSAEADQLLSESRKILAPELIRTEVGGAITRKARNGKISGDYALSLCEMWIRQLKNDLVTLIPDEDIFESAALLSVQIKHPIQDCLYLAVARHLDLPLITADKPFRDRAVPFDKRVALLAGCEDN